MTESKESYVDYSFFWKRFRKPDGQLGATIFDVQEFKSIFGVRASTAFVNYLLYKGNPPTTTAERRRYGRALMDIKRFVNEDPEVILAAQERAEIEDLK